MDFSDVGHFGRASVQIGLACVVWPCLMLQYLGQAAYIIENPSSTANSFYLSIPGGANTPQYWIMFILATLATVIASQALIIGVFSILRQMIHIDCFPAFKVKHTSSTTAGQVYIPAINYMLMIGVIATTIGFKTSNNVTAAYGLGVSLDFIVTTTLITFCMIYVLHWPWYVSAAFAGAFGALDMCLVIANVKKIPHGAWFPLMVAILCTCFISFWRWARGIKVDNEYGRRIRIGEVFSGIHKNPDLKPRQTLILSSKGKDPAPLNHVPDKDSIGLRDVVYFIPTHRLAEDVLTRADVDDDNDEESPTTLRLNGGVEVGIMPNTAAIFHTNATHTLHSPHTVPAILSQLLHVCPALPEYVIFMGVRIVDAPFIDADSRIAVRAYRTSPRFHRCVVRFGFMDHVDIDDEVVAQILARIPSAQNVTSVYHIIENESIFAKRKYPTKSIRGVMQAIRAAAIEWVFSPIDRVLGHRNYIRANNMWQNNDGLHNGIETLDKKVNVLYIGSNVYL